MVTGVLVANGIEAVEVVLFGDGPVEVARVSMVPGLTVLYGANGAGKSTVLNGVVSALRGVTGTAGDCWLRCRLAPEYSGFDPTLLTRIALAVRDPAGGDPSTDLPDPPEDSDDPWQRAMLSLIYGPRSEQAEAMGVEDGWLYDQHRLVVERLRADLSQVVGSGESAAWAPGGVELDLVLVAEGTVDDPGWELYASRLVDDTSAFEAVRGQPGSEFWPISLQDGARLARRRDGGPVRLERIGRIEATDATRCLSGDDAVDVDNAPAATSHVRAPGRKART